MYKALLEIGGYKPGDKVPEEKAKIWIGMYDVPHVQKVDEEKEKKIEKVDKEIEKPVRIEKGRRRMR